ncbi:hypothetical protein BRD06_05585 [Halobacteriales archaeon QS_9_67_15]|nr:MAG: hypothetical protein BRD06_05585 [Halobacteriales archaeon QS_9_67_15]
MVVALTGVGVGALELWLALVGGVPPLSRPVAVGVVVLMAGMQVVHFLTDLAVNGVEVGFPLGATLVVSVTEAVLWSGPSPSRSRSNTQSRRTHSGSSRSGSASSTPRRLGSASSPPPARPRGCR